MTSKITTPEESKEKFNSLYNKINVHIKGQNVGLAKEVLKTILSGIDYNSTID